MLVGTNVEKQQEQRKTLFLVVKLVGCPIDHDLVCDHI